MNVTRFTLQTFLCCIGAFLPISVLHTQTVNKGILHISEDAIFSTHSDFDNRLSAALHNDGKLFVFKDYRNNGIVDYTTGGTLYFYGNNSQWIQGQITSFLYDVVFDNNTQSNFFMEGSFTIASKANFQSGIVNNRDYGGTFLFESSGEAHNTSDISHVNGTVNKIAVVDFTYPIGNGAFFRPAILATGENTSKEDIESIYYSENSAAISPHSLKEVHIDFINDTEYWYINAKTSKQEALLTLSWHEETTADEIMNSDPENLSILYWDRVVNRWIDKGGAVDIENESITTTITDYGIYTFGFITSNVSEGEIEIFNAVTPGSDNLNDFFRIEGINAYPNNLVTIFNRWGVKVFEQQRYDNDLIAFRGYSDGRATINSQEPLPAGTYFYTIEFVGESYPGKKNFTGYLYIH